MAEKTELKAVNALVERRKRRARNRRRKIILVVEVIVLIALLIVAGAMWMFGKFQRVEIDENDIEINLGAGKDGYTTIALFGGDSREGQLEAGTHADTIIIVSIDNESREVRMASVYRDTILQQANQTYHKANNAYFHGGPVEAINLLNKNMDLDITDYVTVDFKAMADVVDLLGGVEIEVTDEEAKMMNHYIKETAKVSGKDANKLKSGGTYVLDGPQAVTYARLRKLEGGDYKRTERQRTVLKALAGKMEGVDIPTMSKIVDTVFPQISTSFSTKECLAFAVNAPSFKLVGSEGFPFEKTDGITYGRAGSVVVSVGHKENVEELHKYLYPNAPEYVASETIERISADISWITNVARPADMEWSLLEKMEEQQEEQQTDTQVEEN